MDSNSNALPTPSPHPHPHPNPCAESPNPSLTLSPDSVYNNNNTDPHARGGARDAHIKGHTPPPAYASLSPHPYTPSALPPFDAPPTSSSPPSSWPASSSEQPYSSSSLYPHPSSGFGPTPLTSGHPLLAVPHAYIGAPGAADRRARWRFVGSFLCALVLFLAVGSVLGLGAWGEWGGGTDGGWVR